MKTRPSSISHRTGSGAAVPRKLWRFAHGPAISRRAGDRARRGRSRGSLRRALAPRTALARRSTSSEDGRRLTSIATRSSDADFDEPGRPAPRSVASIAAVTTGRRPSPPRLRQGPRDVRPRRRVLMVASRPDLDVRRRPSRRRSPTRARCSPGSRSSGSSRRRHRAQPPHLGHRGRARRGARPRAARAQARDAAGRVRRARLHHGLGLEGLPGDRRGLRDRAARRACRSPSSCPSRSSRRRPRPRSATTTRTSTSTAPPRSSATARCWRGCATSRSRSTRSPPSTRASAGSSSPTRSSSSASTPSGELVLGDEVADARLLALLAGRRVRARPRPAELRQAVRARLGVGEPAGTRRRPRPAIPDDIVARTRAKLRRGLRADHRRAVRRLAGADRRP